LKFHDIVSLTCNIGTNVKKMEWYHSRHVKNHKLFAFHSHGSVAIELANGVHHKIINFMGSLNLCKIYYFIGSYCLKSEWCALNKYETCVHDFFV
jgi:hypothetical protein